MVIPTLLLLAHLRTDTVCVFPRPDEVAITGPAVSFSTVRVLAAKGLENELDEAQSALVEAGVGKGDGQTMELRVAKSDLGEEGYTLSIFGKRVIISGGSAHGVFNGIQTFRQLLKPETTGASLPQVEVRDHPRFAWRGLMIDVSRHFYPAAEIKHFIDVASRYKIDRFHWHLNDDGGWRLEIKRYPELTRRGAFRYPATGEFPEYSGLSFPAVAKRGAVYGGFYTQEEVRNVVAYAATKHVEIVPEIEMPGHNLALTTSYPSLVCDPGLRDAWRKESDFDFPNIVCPGKESSYEFVQNVLDEVLALFPSKVIHIGGDEVDKFLWTRCADCKARMAAEGLTKPEQLESYFIQRIERYLNRKGRSIIGWDEILEGGLAPNAKVMSWHGKEGGIEAARLKHEVVMTPMDWCYFNGDYSELPTSRVLEFDPAPRSMGADARFVIGGECCLWTEAVPNLQLADNLLYPRLLALSQAVWSTSREDYASFERRLQTHLPDLARLCPTLHVDPPVAKLNLVGPGEPVEVSGQELPGLDLQFTRVAPTGTLRPLGELGNLGPGEEIWIGYYHQGFLVSDQVRVEGAALKSVRNSDLIPGLTQDIYEGRFLTMPDFTHLKRTMRDTVREVRAVDPDRLNYAQRLSGYLRISKAGVYRFRLGSDDGAHLWIGGAKLIDDRTIHGYAIKEGRVRLEVGDYPLRIEFIQLGGLAKLTLEMAYGNEPYRPVDPGSLFQSVSGS